MKHSIRSWLARFLRKSWSVPRKAESPFPRFRPQMELLEDRINPVLIASSFVDIGTGQLLPTVTADNQAPAPTTTIPSTSDASNNPPTDNPPPSNNPPTNNPPPNNPPPNNPPPNNPPPNNPPPNNPPPNNPPPNNPPPTTFNAGPCLTDPSLVTNEQYFVNGSPVSQLQGNVQEGSTVGVEFTIAGNQNVEVSLVSYSAPSKIFDWTTAGEQHLYEYATGCFSPGEHEIEINVPQSFFQVDFVAGDVIPDLGPGNSNNFYSSQGRLIASGNGGSDVLNDPSYDGPTIGGTSNPSQLTNLQYEVNGNPVSTLAGNINEGDRITVNFDVAAGPDVEVSLGSYIIVPGSSGNSGQAYRFDAETGWFSPGEHQLEVVAPPSMFQVVFKIGKAPEQYATTPGLQNTEPSGWLLAIDSGGTHLLNVINAPAPSTYTDGDNGVTDPAAVTGIQYSVNGTPVSTLAGNVNQGDTVTVSFDVTGSQNVQLALASYMATGPNYDPTTAEQDHLYDFQLGSFAPGQHQLQVTVPSSYFDLAFISGPVIVQFGPDGTANDYVSQNRLIDSTSGGTQAASASVATNAIDIDHYFSTCGCM